MSIIIYLWNFIYKRQIDEPLLKNLISKALRQWGGIKQQGNQDYALSSTLASHGHAVMETRALHLL